MADPVVAAPERPVLVVIPDVEILEVGERWPLATDAPGFEGTFTADDLAAAVAAQADPAVRSGVLKAGAMHGAMAEPPTFGRMQNLRTTNNGMTLVCDLVGVPAWMAEIMPYAWPSRSIEADRNLTTDTGKTHALVINGLALLSVHLGAISTLEDVRALYSAESMEQAGVTLTMGEGAGDASAAAGRGVTSPPCPTAQKVAGVADESVAASVAAGVTTDDIRRDYYDNLGPGQDWWWIRELLLAPTLALIVDDDQGHLWQVPVTLAGESIEYGAPFEVQIDYKPVASGAASAARAGPRRIIWASRAQSRGEAVDLKPLREALGLAEDVTDEQVMEAAQAAASEREAAQARVAELEKAGAPPEDAAAAAARAGHAPPGSVVVDAETWEETKAQAKQGAEAARIQREQARASFVESVAQAGKLKRSNKALRATLEREWDRDPEGAKAFAAELAIEVPVEERGHALGAEAAEVDYDQADAALFPELRHARGAPSDG